MKFKEFKEIFEELWKNYLNRENYVETLPRDIRDSFFDNEYVNSYGIDHDLLIKKLFGEELSEAVFWFMYDRSGHDVNLDHPNVVTGDGKEYYIRDIDSFLNYIAVEYF